MKTLHLSIIIIFSTSLVIVSNNVVADNSTSTAYGGLVGFRVANFKSDHATYSIWYKIANSTVVGTPLDLPAKALIFMINASSDGELTVELPRSIIDSKNGTKDIPYYVSVDDIATLIGRPFPVQANEINDDNLRIVKINFTKTTKEIEIVGTYFVENYSSKTEHSSKTFSPLQQFKSGVLAKDVQCKQGFEAVLKLEDNSPACVKPSTYVILAQRGWAFEVYPSPVNSNEASSTGTINVTNLKFENNNETGTLTIKNQTYYFDTPNYTETAYVHPVQISFHDVVFTLFPESFRGGLPTGNCNSNGSDRYYWVDAEFPNGIHELLDILVESPPCVANPTPTKLSAFSNPQAGLTFYDGKMRLLVSTENQTSSTLRLYLSLDSTDINPAEQLGVYISLNNTSSKPLILAKADDWLRNDLSLGPCSNLPFGIAILKGYYTEQNMTDVSSVQLYPNIPCPGPLPIKSYTFEPLSSKTTQECDGPFSCPGLSEMKIHLKINGFLDNNGQHRPFNVGTYTIVGGDEWGSIVIQHFTVAYATPLTDSKVG